MLFCCIIIILLFEDLSFTRLFCKVDFCHLLLEWQFINVLLLQLPLPAALLALENIGEVAMAKV